MHFNSTQQCTAGLGAVSDVAAGALLKESPVLFRCFLVDLHQRCSRRLLFFIRDGITLSRPLSLAKQCSG